MSTRRISMCGGPCLDSYITAGGLHGHPPPAFWAVRDADGDVGCIKGDASHPPALDRGEVLLGCYQYDAAADAYTWRPAVPEPWRGRAYPDGHHLAT